MTPFRLFSDTVGESIFQRIRKYVLFLILYWLELVEQSESAVFWPVALPLAN